MMSVYQYSSGGEMWSDAVAVHPWVGNLYTNPLHFKQRTLILGESNYTTPENYKSSLVIDCVLDDMSTHENRDTTGFCRFSTKIRRTIWGRDESIGPLAFWKNVAFYNFVQPLVGDRARMRPTDEMWEGSASAFAEVMLLLQPARVLVLGKANWDNLLQRVPHEKIGQYVAEIEVASTIFRAGYINHPSSSLSYSTWHPIANAFLFS
jgi:hypothetical protein